jgi:tRNA threonylcarbamoyl adenosine modification protein (Sua5/YciO/YrdC/YwlC family)
VRRLASHELDVAASLLEQGELVAIPTDTVYGLAACIERQEAVRGLFTAKGRPTQVALPVLVADLAAAHDLVGPLPSAAVRLAERFWPGALTLVVPCDEALAGLLGSSSPTVGLRAPDDEAAQQLLVATGPLAVTSANRHGEPECRSADEVIERLDGGAVAAVLDAGERRGRPSTVLRVGEDASVELLREGSLSLASIEAVLSEG